MNAFAPFQSLDVACLQIFGETVTYSRPAGLSLDAVAPFQLTAVINSGEKYADPTSGIFADAFVQASSIPLGPFKGDLVVLTNPTQALPTGTYKVQQVFQDSAESGTHLKLRWTGT